MKKYFAILLMAFAVGTVVSCESREEVIVDNSAKNIVYDLKNVNFTAANNYSYYSEFNRPMLGSDFVLMFRKKNPEPTGTVVWEPIPKTIYISGDREVDYDFDFSIYDIKIIAGSNYDISTTPEYANNQSFRVVLVPGEYGGKSNIDLTKLSYKEVIEKYNIDDSNVIDLK